LSFVYLDQAATSWPKPPEVGRAMLEALEVAGSPSRSAHSGALKAERILSNARRSAARFFSVSNSDNLICVPSATYGLNMVLCSYAQQPKLFADHEHFIAYSGGEHNAVTRALAKCAHSFSQHSEVGSSESELQNLLIEVRLRRDGIIDLEHAKEIFETKAPVLLACQQGSNVTGRIQPILELALLCKEYGVDFIVDGSQVAGHIPLKLDELTQAGVSAWVCSGHKGLLGPAGSGLVYLSEDFQPHPLVVGGTGSGEHFANCRNPERPTDYEAGTPGLPAIAGLAAGIEIVGDATWHDFERESEKTQYMLRGLSDIDGVRILGFGKNEAMDAHCEFVQERLPIASIVVEGKRSDELAFLLDSKYQIASRAGLHCSPLTHRSMDSYPDGALRLSWNAYNTFEDCDRVLDALRHLCGRL